MWLKSLAVYLLLYIGYTSCYTNSFDVSIPVSDRNDFFNFSLSADSKISKRCSEQIKEYEAGILNGSLWALQMLDARANFPSSGILQGNVLYLGNFDMCINVNHNNEIFGKYCLGTLPVLGGEQQKKSIFTNPENRQTPEGRMVTPDGALSVMFATCLPDSCSAEDFEEYYKNKLLKFNFHENFCSSKSSQPELDSGDIATISLLSVVFYIILMSTVFEGTIFYMKKKSLHPILTAFSLITNTKKLLQTTSEPGNISCLHGIRVISMMWVLLGHRYTISSMIPTVNLLSFVDWLLATESMIVLGATVSVDTFFLLAGLLVSYGFLNATSKGFKFNIFIYYFHRFLRLTPLLGVLILIHATVLKHLGSGPLWNTFINQFSSGCEKYWWSTLLHIQNFVNPENMCIPQTWYLSADTQLFLLSPLLLVPLKKWPKIGLALTGLLTVFSIITCFVIGWIDEIYGFIIANQGPSMEQYMEHYYIQPYTRAAPWLIGIILGYIIFDIKQRQSKISINKFLSLFLWFVSLTILLACVFTGQNMIEKDYVYDKFENAIYLALMRPGWALGVSWVIFACITGYGGPVNWFLSLPVFQVVSKVTYSMYLIHMTMMVVVSAQTRISVYFSNLLTMYNFWGDFAFTFGAAVLFSLAFESPILIIEKIIFGKKGKRPQLKEEVQQPEERLEKIEIS